jgi:poly-gamma-glutamate synthesis protein (capsule biosynthesis protein)
VQPRIGDRIHSVRRRSALFGLCCLLLAGVAFTAAVVPRDLVTIVAVGDVMMSRNVAAKMRDAGDPLLALRNVSALLDSSDLNFGNLESPLFPPAEWPAGAPAPDGMELEWDGIIGGKSLIFAAPNKSVQAMARYRFRVLMLANNHAMDQGEEGLTHTVRRLAANNIQAVGAGADLEEAWQARIVELRGWKIGFLAVSYASLNYGTPVRNNYVARIEDLDLMRSRVHALKSQAAYIVVGMHAGSEYTSEPGAAQVTFAHAAIDAGADLVIGSHPHWLQPFERYKGGLIFYSLGNFVFDLDSSPETRQGAAVKLFLSGGKVVAGEVLPIQIENSCCPRPARPDEIPGALRRMRLKSTHIPLPREIRSD